MNELLNFILVEFLAILSGNFVVFVSACLLVTIFVIIFLDRIF